MILTQNFAMAMKPLIIVWRAELVQFASPAIFKLSFGMKATGEAMAIAVVNAQIINLTKSY